MKPNIFSAHNLLFFDLLVVMHIYFTFSSLFKHPYFVFSSNWCFNVQVHVLPQEILGESTFAIILMLVKIFPVWIADCILLFAAWCKWQNTAKCGLPRPKEGPIAYKNRRRRTPVLDIGTLCLVKSGHIKVIQCQVIMLKLPTFTYTI